MSRGEGGDGVKLSSIHLVMCRTRYAMNKASAAKVKRSGQGQGAYHTKLFQARYFLWPAHSFLRSLKVVNYLREDGASPRRGGARMVPKS
jgi:hypothetical protein